MTTTPARTTEPVDEAWVAHVRELGSAVLPPTPADPHAMSRTAVRRTRTRRAVLATGGGALTVAVFAGAAFALAGPTTGVLLPGAGSSGVSTSASADPSVGPSSGAAEVPAGWEVHELEGLTYAVPPGIVASGPVQDEPGESSDMWHDAEDPDAPPFLRVAHVTPDYEFYDSTAGGLTQTPGDAATPFDLPGASVATVEDGSEELREIMAMPEGSSVRPVRILVHRADDPARYIVTMTLPTTTAPSFVDTFLSTLSLT